MLIWDYIKEFIVPHPSSKIRTSWTPLLPERSTFLPPLKKLQKISPKEYLAKWFLKAHRTRPHGPGASGQAPRETHSSRTTPHR